MNAADAAIIRNIRREFGKRPIESTRIDVQATNGRVSIGGVLTRMRDKPDVDLQHELDMVTKMVLRDRDVKDVQVQVRLVFDDHTQDKGHDARGRMRH